MLELFKGQIDIEYLKNKMSYKEVLHLRQARVTRLEKERLDLEKERDIEKQKAERANARTKILNK